MSTARESLGRLVILGDGQVGVLTAIALRRALPTASVTIVACDPDPAAFADTASTALPFTNKLHDRLGLSEDMIVARAGGSHRLLTRYFGWGGEGHHGSASYGSGAQSLQTAAFGLDWGGGSRSGSDDASGASIADALVAAGRFAPPPPDTDTPLAEIDYALRWNARAYHGLLVQLARSLNLTHIPATLSAVEPDDAGGVASITLADGQRLTADLFIDCSGPQALLGSTMPEFALSDWSDSLPTRSLFVAPRGGAMLSLEDRLTVLPGGWLSEIAGRDGLQTMLGAGEDVSADNAAAMLGSHPVARFTLQPGCLKQSWIGNVICIGDAFARFEPLGGFNLDLAHRQIDLLLELLPGLPFVDLERAEFNRRAGLMADAVRDVIALHFAAPGAVSLFAAKQVPDAVVKTIDQFTRRGRLPFTEENPLLTQETLSLLTALGFDAGMPPQFRASRRRDMAGLERSMAAKRDAAVSFAPPYQQWIGQVLQQASQA